MVKIGDVILPHGLYLGPMAGYSDYAMRQVAKDMGAEFVTTEMVSAKALTFGDKKTSPIAALTKEELPGSVQLFGHEADVLAEAAKLVAAGQYGEVPTAIDLNMGCPVHKIVSGGDGSCLMKTPVLAGRLVEAVKAAVPLPVTVKMRIGWDREHLNGIEFAKTLESAGADLICVHGRTRSQGYSGEADIDMIARIRESVSVPLVANGDIRDVASALRMYEKTGCDGIMIGRGAIGNPFLFREIAAALEGTVCPPPTPEEKFAIAKRQLTLAIQNKGETVAVLESRKQIGEYLRGCRAAAIARRKINAATQKEEVLSILQDVLLGDGQDLH